MNQPKAIRKSAVALVSLVLSFSGVVASYANAEPTYGQPEIISFPNGFEHSFPESDYINVDCASEGNCTAIGHVRDSSNSLQAFTQTQTGGVWSEPVLVVFPDGIRTNTDSETVALDCTSAGNCTIVGTFINLNRNIEAFTVTQDDGIWGQAVQVVFPQGVQNSSPYSEIKSVSCSAPGDCTVAGRFKTSLGDEKAFTQTQTDGIWALAVTATFEIGIENSTAYTEYYAIDCPSAGNCSAVGSFKNAAGNTEAFTHSQTAGVWETATPITTSIGIQSVSPMASFSDISCVSNGNCTATGILKNSDEQWQAFTQMEAAGVWGDPVLVIFEEHLQSNEPNPVIDEIICSSIGNCSAAGFFYNSLSFYEGFTLTQTDGSWGQALPVEFAPGVRVPGKLSELYSIDCYSAGNCMAVGSYGISNGENVPYSVIQIDGVWGISTPLIFPENVQATNPGDWFNSVSCVSSGSCVAVGTYRFASNSYRAFSQVINNGSVAPAPTTPAPSTPPPNATVITTSPEVAPNTPAVVVYSPTISVGGKLTGKSIATGLGIATPKKSKTTLVISKSSKKYCKVKSGKIVGVKKGTCLATVTVQAPKPMKGKKPAPVKKSVTVQIF